MFWNTSEAIVIHHYLVTHHSSCREGLIWLALARKHLIHSRNLGIECCFRCGETIPEESSPAQTCHIHTQTQKVLKHLRSNYYPCLRWTPHHWTCREGPTWLDLAEKQANWFLPFGYRVWCFGCWEMSEESFQTFYMREETRYLKHLRGYGHSHSCYMLRNNNYHAEWGPTWHAPLFSGKS